MAFSIQLYLPGEGPFGNFTRAPRLLDTRTRVRRDAEPPLQSANGSMEAGSRIQMLYLTVMSNCSIGRAEMVVSNCIESETEDFANYNTIIHQGSVMVGCHFLDYCRIKTELISLLISSFFPFFQVFVFVCCGRGCHSTPCLQGLSAGFVPEDNSVHGLWCRQPVSVKLFTQLTRVLSFVFYRCTSDAELTSASPLYPLQSALTCAVTPLHQEPWLVICTLKLTQSALHPSAFWPQLLQPVQFPLQPPPGHQLLLSPPLQMVKSCLFFFFFALNGKTNKRNNNAMLVCCK